MIVNFQDLTEKVRENIYDGTKLKDEINKYTEDKKQEFSDATEASVKTILSVYLNAYIELMLLNGTDVSG